MTKEKDFSITDLETALRREGVPDETIQKFVEYLARNLSIWFAFEKHTNEAITAGVRVGAKCVAERVRWLVEVESGGQFKIQNSYVAYLARLFMTKYPEHIGYFDTRPVKGVS